MVNDKDIANYFEKAVSVCPEEAKKICNWISTEVLSILNIELISIKEFKVSPENTGLIIKLIKENKITGKIAKQVFPEMIKTGKSPLTIIKEQKLEVISDEKVLTNIIETIMKANPKIVQNYRNGNERVFGFFVGQIMKETNGQANPTISNQLLKKLLSNSNNH